MDRDCDCYKLDIFVSIWDIAIRNSYNGDRKTFKMMSASYLLGTVGSVASVIA